MLSCDSPNLSMIVHVNDEILIDENNLVCKVIYIENNEEIVV